jgi:hypothetical protein
MKRTQYIQHLRANLLHKLTATRPVIDGTFGAENFVQFKEYALQEFDDFSVTIPFLQDKNNQGNFSYGPFLLASYKTPIRHYSYSDSRAMEFVRQIIEHLGRYDLEHMNPVMKLAYANIGKYAFLQKLMQGYFKYSDEPMGWQAVIRDEKGVYLAADMTACGLFQWLSLNQAPGICAAACAVDYVTVGAMPHLKLERKETIANGDPVCSFRYIRKML